MDQRIESPMKCPLFIFFARLSVCLDFFSGTTLRNFLIFWMKFFLCILPFSNFSIFSKSSCSPTFGLKGPKMGPKWGFSSFRKNLCTECLWCLCQNGPKMKLFKFYENQCMDIFWFFALKSCTVAFGQKRAQKEFPKPYNKLMHSISLIFSMNLQQHRDWKFGEVFFLTKFLFWSF